MVGVTENPQPVELLSSLYTVTSAGVTETTGNGAALSPAWGSSFTIADKTSINIDLSIPYVVNTGAAVAVEAIVLIDGVAVGRGLWFMNYANVGNTVTRKLRVSGLSAGAHNIAVQLKVGGGTGSIICSTTDPGVLIVSEA